ncbi:DUF2254 domain-containing protein [Salinisphaera sp.]|uniref:DUF2254 domain-containing protein n=1 Tax=Salinisphaera sp. TaxID=1914330 RepID=UPI002D7957FB|nr:DUF2254 domain-containing protein [Salinisphaera sp.]HET7313280.1 DUF2254 domain-containing protein [Salinisphaera sp.]
MRARAYEFWELARSSFWFLPSLMMLVGLVLFAITITIDELHLTGRFLHRVFYSGGPSNATNLLQALTGAMVAIATVVFSTMMVVLTLATSQFGHRLIRSFMRDRANQAVLGIFLATFVYCMLVFHMVGNDPKNQFVPGVSISVGFVLALFATCTLIYFTHHMAELFSAPEVLETVGVEFDQAIHRMYPAAESGEVIRDGDRAPELGSAAQEIQAHDGGYVQAIGVEALLEIACNHDVVIESRVSYGDYVLPGNVVARIHGAALDDEKAGHVIREYVLGRSRLTDHDLVFAINQMAEIAVRALSPALNNPFTALDCVNRIGRSLAILIERPLPAEGVTDKSGEIRVVIRLPSFQDLLDAAFMPIRNYGRTSVITMREMLRVIAKLAPLTRRDEERRALARHAETILEAAGHGLCERVDLERIRASFADTRQALAAVGEMLPEAAKEGD